MADGLVDAVAEGRLIGLRAVRDTLAAAIEVGVQDRDLAALSLRLMDAMEQIEAAERAQPAAKGTALDEFTKRRAEREAKSPTRPAKRQQRGG